MRTTNAKSGTDPNVTRLELHDLRRGCENLLTIAKALEDKSRNSEMFLQDQDFIDLKNQCREQCNWVCSLIITF